MVVPTVVPKRSRPWLWAIPAALLVVVAVVVVVALVGGDDGGTSSGTGVFEGTADEDGAAVISEVSIRAGDVIRVRAEPSSELDVQIAVGFTDEQVRAYAEAVSRVFPDAGDPDELADQLFDEVPDEFTGAAAAALDGRRVYLVDWGSSGEPDADWFPAFANGTVVVVAGSYSGAGDVRLIIEQWDETFDVDDSEALSGEDMFTGPFFDEAAFYDDDAPYEVTGE